MSTPSCAGVASDAARRWAVLLGLLLAGTGCPQLLDDRFSTRGAALDAVDAAVGGSCGAFCGGSAGVGGTAGAGGRPATAGAGGGSGAGSAGQSSGGTGGSLGGASSVGGGGVASGSSGTGGGTGGAAGTSGVAGTSGGTGGAGTLEALRACPFGTPEPLVGLDFSAGSEWGPSLTADGLTLFFEQDSGGNSELYRATRADRGTTFSTPVALTALNTADDEGTPYVSANGLRLYFFSTRAGGEGGKDIYVATRSDVTAEFSNPQPLQNVNSSAYEHLPRLAGDDLTLLFTSTRSGGADLWTASRITDTAYTVPQLYSAINSASGDESGGLTADGLVLIFDSTRNGTGNNDIFITTRSSADQPFPAPTALSVVNSSVNEYNVLLTRDERELFFSSNRTAGSTHHLFRALRSCD